LVIRAHFIFLQIICLAYTSYWAFKETF